MKYYSFTAVFWKYDLLLSVIKKRNTYRFARNYKHCHTFSLTHYLSKCMLKIMTQQCIWYTRSGISTVKILHPLQILKIWFFFNVCSAFELMVSKMIHKKKILVNSNSNKQKWKWKWKYNINVIVSLLK